MTNFNEVFSPIASAEFSRGEIEGGATTGSKSLPMANVKAGRPVIIAALLLAFIGAWAVHFASS
jgi:hypothetical protein